MTSVALLLSATAVTPLQKATKFVRHDNLTFHFSLQHLITSSSRRSKPVVANFYTFHEELTGLTKPLLNPLPLKKTLKKVFCKAHESFSINYATKCILLPLSAWSRTVCTSDTQVMRMSITSCLEIFTTL